LLTDQNEISNLYRGPSIDASYQVLVHLAKRFQRRRFKCESLRRRTPSDGKSSFGLWPGELKTALTIPLQIKPNLAGKILRWVRFKIVSDKSALHSRWLMLQKIEMSSIVHCCFIINQNELKF
jgi:hypothetical protein